MLSKKSRYLVFCVLSCFVLSGCAAALVGGLLYKSSKSKEAKQEFIKEYRQTNLEREKAGLEPLDLCTEKYHFDEGWAKNDPQCKIRIDAYEAGDENALGNQELPEIEDTNPNSEG